jgi:hypothetical protein
MRILLSIVLVWVAGVMAAAQEERPVPKDSARVSIAGCARGRTFIAGPPREHEPVRTQVEEGRRFRLAGPKALLNEIKLKERSMVEITGLVRRAQLEGPGGVSILGGRVRIGGTPTATSNDPRRNPGYNEAVLDVEAWRPLPEPCPDR